MSGRSLIHDFPPEVRAEVDRMIEMRASSSAIHRMLKDKYKDIIHVPSLPTVLNYVRNKMEINSRPGMSGLSKDTVVQFTAGLAELAKVADQARTKNEPNFSKIRILEGLVGKCALRILAIEEATSKTSKIFPGNEQAMVKYISEIKSIIESVIKLSTDLRKDDEEIIQLIHAEAQAFLKMVKAVVLDVCPEKYELFKARLRDGLKIKSIELNVDDSDKYEKKGPTDSEILLASGSLPEMASAPEPETISVPVTETVPDAEVMKHVETVDQLTETETVPVPETVPVTVADAEVQKRIEEVQKLVAEDVTVGVGVGVGETVDETVDETVTDAVDVANRVLDEIVEDEEYGK